MDQKKIRKVLVAIKKKIESVATDESCIDLQLLEIIEELKIKRIEIGGLIEKLDLQ